MKRAALSSIAMACLATGAQAQLEINLDYTGFNAGPAGDLNTILNGASIADARAVMDHAAAVWEDAFANSSSGLDWANSGVVTQNIAVTWGPKGGSTLATGGTGWFSSGDNAFSSGSLTWDDDASSTFFVDTTPNDNSEWRQYSERDLNLGGVNVNVERVSYDAPAGTARTNSDMLSIAIHEMGHALGWLGSYPQYDSADLGNDNDIDITSGAFTGADIPINGGHTNLTIGRPGNDAKGPGRSDFPYDPGSGWFNNDDYNPTIMAPSIFTGVRYGLTEADILVVAEYLDFDMTTVNFAPAPGSGVSWNGSIGNWNNDASWLSAGSEPTAGDDVTIDAGTVTVNQSGEVAHALRVGVTATAALNIQSGGVLSTSDSYLGVETGSIGTVTVTGNSATWISDNLYVGGEENQAGGTGSLSLLNGGRVDVAGTLRLWNGAIVNLNGGTIDATTIDHTHGGDFNFIDGTLSVESFQGNLTQQGGTLAPGNSPGTTTITGDYNLNAGSLDIELGGTIAGTDHDQVVVNGTLALANASNLDLQLIDNHSPSFGEIYTVVEADAITGTFGTVQGVSNQPGLASNQGLAVTYTADEVRVTAALLGDANLDGDVDVFQFNGNGDAQILSSNLGQTSGQTWADGDFNGDGDVDVFQFNGGGDAQLLSSNLGATAPAASIITDFALAAAADVAAPDALASAGTAEATYDATTGELFFDIGSGVGVVGLESIGNIIAAGIDDNSIFGAPIQINEDTIAFFDANGLTVGEDSLGFVLEAGLTQADLGFSFTPLGGQSAITSVTIIPEPSSLALLGLGALGLLRRRRSRVA